MANDQQQPELPSNNFLAVLQRKEIQEGLLTEASGLLAELAIAVKASKKKGSLSLVLSLEPEKDAISVAATLNLKAPSTTPQHLTIFFLDSQGALVRDNPEQQEMKLTAHEGGKNEEEQSEAAQAL